MNLVIDQGNTICKVGIYADGVLQVLVEERKLEIKELERLLGAYPEVNAAIYSSVALRDEEVLGYLNEHLAQVLELTSETPVPLEIDYDRKALGGDRLAAVVAALDYADDKSEILVLDIGTALTIERISKGVFLGGNISPGVTTRLKALRNCTARLPFVEGVKEVRGFGLETSSAIERGVLQGVLYEIEGYIRSIRKDYPKALVFFTGGYAPFLSTFLQEEVELKADMVLYGLNSILAYNYNVK